MDSNATQDLKLETCSPCFTFLQVRCHMTVFVFSVLNWVKLAVEALVEVYIKNIFAFEKFPRLSLVCKLAPVPYGAYKYRVTPQNVIITAKCNKNRRQM